MCIKSRQEQAAHPCSQYVRHFLGKDTGDNGVHGSASPFEALAERCNWLQASIETDAFGKALVASGIPLPTLTDEWFNDPQVDFEGALTADA